MLPDLRIAKSEIHPRVAALVLAGGQSKRMGYNKLLARLSDAKLVIQQTVDTLLVSAARPIIVVTGHHSGEVATALRDRPVFWAHNPSYTHGMSSSLKAGLAEVPSNADGLLIGLADMPWITIEALTSLIAAHLLDRSAICVPVYGGQRGHPVLWPRRYFEAMQRLAGDVGAKSLLKAHPREVVEIEMSTPGVLLDLDTESDLHHQLLEHSQGKF